MLTLASRLRALDDAALRRTIEARALPSTGIKDFFDLAEALLDSPSLEATLAHLDRATLAVLAVSGKLAAELAGPPSLDELVARLRAPNALTLTPQRIDAIATALDALMLAVYTDGRLKPYAAVSQHLDGWPQHGLPSPTELAEAAAPPTFAEPSESDRARTSALAAERAFAAVSSVAELVSDIAREPVHELSRGGLGLPDSKRLATAASVEPEALPALVAIAARAGLIGRENGLWMETETGQSWLLTGTARRWEALAASWRESLPADVLAVLPAQAGVFWDGELRDYLGWLYPAGGPWLDERVTAVQAEAEYLGITALAATSAAGAAVLTGSLDAAATILADSLPAEVGSVYLQHDLSIVSPGPLSPSIDARIRALADVESRELASSYRITAASVNRALAAGETAESLLDFLQSISLTGIPQPVHYLIHESAARYGRVRVRGVSSDDDPTVRSWVHSDDAALLGTIEVDQTVSPLGLHQIAEMRLGSRYPADVVFWALSDARYPVAAENGEGDIIHLHRVPLARAASAPAVDPVAELVAKLRTSDGGEAQAAGAWLARQLDVAIRSKQTVTVSIAMPGGVVVDYLLEPASVGGGRFRARDRRADIERTLPLSSIISISPMP
ncbi:helicase-associated domain-containing protein [Glaciibacter psychrotolerans]|uniref:Helicase XPB/Ssl2 N-terminal domain-containing protein n=1 Tax=Glaciibacter psychrotolerans TaxID=670054 RepID=A0A7Z0EBR1_9MICO|nr:helicase-associated domain-containing protein [Leifsonia psychrotolerans]NYJ18265.1 hypothetical protein [Leifsonia psychrotolerans]